MTKVLRQTRKKMDPEIKAKWIANLRSGKFTQVTGGLKVGDAYCCLGVLCETVGIKPVITCNEEEFTYDGELCILPDKVLKQCKLSTTAQAELVALNDSVGYNFDEIATVIEAEL